MSHDLFWAYPSHMEIDEEGKTVFATYYTDMLK